MNRLRDRLAILCAIVATGMVATRLVHAQATPAREETRAPVAVAPVADSAGISATSAIPWNPPVAAPASLPWEAALRLPGRVVTLPMTALGQISRRSLLVVEEKSLVPRTLVLLQVLPRAGLAIAPASLGDRTGFGARVQLAPPPLAHRLEVEYSGSTRHYERTRAALIEGPARLEYVRDWRPSERFYGLGMSARLDDTTNFSSSFEALTLSLAPAWQLGPTGHPARLEARVWAGGRGVGVGRGREDGVTPLEVAQPGPGGSAYSVGGSQWIGGASLSLDTRAGRPHWSRGDRISLAAEATSERHDPRLLFVEPSGRAPSDHARLTAEFETGVSFWRDPRTLRLLVRAQRLDALDRSRPVVLADLPSLGGSAGLAGFEPGRFRDAASVLSRLSYLFPLAQHFEIDAHVEAGGAFPGLSAARANEIETSFGILLRPRLATAPIGAIGVEWSHEGVRVRFTLGGVE